MNHFTKSIRKSMMSKSLLPLILMLAFSVNAMAYDFKVNGLCYNMCSGGDSVIVSYESSSGNYKSLMGDIVIPQRVNYRGKSYDVVRIGGDAFKDCIGLTTVTIPNSVTEIGEYAFSFCSSLAKVVIPNSVTNISNGAFNGCTSLTAIVIPESVTSIDIFAFSDCPSLSSISVDPSNTTFDSRENCNAIIETATNSLIAGCKSTQIPATVTTIDDAAFYGCSELLSVTIPKSVTNIGYNAFNRCTGLTSLNIPSSVTEIHNSAFSDCTGLTSITISNSVTKIGIYAFEGCTGLTSVDIPNSVTEISWHVFEGCTGLTSVTIPSSVTEIGSNAFEGCTGLTSVIIPSSVIEIGSNAFEGCTGLTSVTIPSSVTEIGSNAFKGCTGLTSVIIPNSVKKIGLGAFFDCVNLKSIISSISAPQNTHTDLTAFRGVNRETCHLVVPLGSLESYSSVAPWLYFTHKTVDASIVNGQTQAQTAIIPGTISLEDQFKLHSEKKEYDKAIEIGERLLALNNTNTLLIRELAYCYYKNNNYSKARAYYEMLAQDKSDSYINEMLGECCMNMSDYVSAEKYYLNAYHHLLSDTTSLLRFMLHRSLGRLLLNLHNCYLAQGKFREAVEPYLRCQLIIQQGFEEQNIPFGLLDLKIIINLEDNLTLWRIKQGGEDLCNQGRYDEALKFYADAIVYYQKIKGEQSHEEAILNERIGRCYLLMQQYSLAKDYLNRSKEIFEKNLEFNIDAHISRFRDRQRMKTLLKLPLLYHERILLKKRVLADDLILDYGIYYASQFNIDSSYTYLGYSVDRIYDNSIHLLGNNTSADRSAYWAKYADLFCEIYPYVALMATEQYKNCKEVNYNYRNLYGDLYNKSALFAKGLLLTSDNEFSRIINESGDSILISRFKELEALKNVPPPLTDEQLQLITDKTTQLERELIVISQEYNGFMENLQHTWEDVQARLDDRDIAIEFLSFPKLRSDSIVYIALTIRKDYDMPHLIALCTQNELNDATQKAYTSNELSNLIWGKLSSELDSVKNIYFSPSGDLHTIAIESMPHWQKTDSLINQCYNIYRLSSTRELVINRDKSLSSKAAVFGDIEYNAPVESMGSPHKEEAADQETSLFAMNDSRGFDADSSGLRGKVWKDLKYAKPEVDSITRILKNKNMEVDIKTSVAATETSFKNLDGKKKSIIHIATHGFCWSDSTARKYNMKNQLSFMTGRNYEDKAMTRTGLLFSGANHCFADGGRDTDSIPAGVDDGVLTALEASLLDLRGLDLLVLSACQTGQGEVGGSEGVFGLQRGFKKAGAQTIIMSLWSVNDMATCDMMTQFYHFYYTCGMTKREAFLKAQLYIKNHDEEYNYDNKEKRTTKPHWAAFIILDALEGR